MTAQVIGFAAAREKRGLPSVRDLYAEHVESVRLHMARERERLRAEALELPGRFRDAALAAVERVTTFDPDDFERSEDPPQIVRGADRLGHLNRRRRYHIETGTIDGKIVPEPETYEAWCREALGALRIAIAEFNKAKGEPGGRRVAQRRRMLREKKRELLIVLFEFGRRRVDHAELEWFTDWDGACTYTRRREPRALIPRTRPSACATTGGRTSERECRADEGSH